MTSGSMKPGPSEDYKALLRGDITSEEYVRRMKLDVDRRFAKRLLGACEDDPDDNDEGIEVNDGFGI